MKLFDLGKDNWARTSPTKEGAGFIAISLFVGFAAINTGNNLLYLTFGVMMSFVVASGIISMINLSRIEVSLLRTGDVFALTPSSLRLSLKNKKSLVPSYSLTAEIDGKTAYVPYLPPGRSGTAAISHVFKGRGFHGVPQVKISTRFPFGFFKKWIVADLGGERVLVFPKIDRLEAKSDTYRARYEETSADKAGFGDDLRSIREFSLGDNPRLIHWKTTARTGRVMVREMEDYESRGAVIEFKPENEGTGLEHHISRVASLLVDLLKKGFEVEFITPDGTFPPSQTGRSPRPVLTYLALYGK